MSKRHRLLIVGGVAGGASCAVGQRAYYVNRGLLQYDFDVRILFGGMQTWQTLASGVWASSPDDARQH